MSNLTSWHDSDKLKIFANLKRTVMNKKLLALALVGAAAYLFKTKKGAEIRKNLSQQAGKWSDKLQEMYHARKNGHPA